jgi:hypothetical protein
MILVLGYVIWRRWLRINRNENSSYGVIVLVIVLLIGLILSPSVVLGSGFHTYDCGKNVISTYEDAGLYLSEKIRPGSIVYWDGVESPAALLYILESEFYPPQLNGQYTFRSAGGGEALYRYGFWNRELADQWLMEADYVLIEEIRYKSEMKIRLRELGGFKRLGKTPPVVTCREGAWIHVLLNERK